MVMEHLTPLEQQRAQSAGEGPPSGYNSWESYRHEQVLSFRDEAAGIGAGAARGAGGSLAWWLTLKTFPYLLLAASIVVFSGWLVDHAAGYRGLLEGAMPGTWIATAPGGTGSPVAVGVAVGVAVAVLALGLTVGRLAWSRWWARSGHGRLVLMVGTYALTVVRMFVLVAGVVAVLGAIGIAEARDLEEPATTGPDRLFPYVVAFAPIVWFSIGSTRRAVRATLERRIALLEQFAG